MKKGLVFLVVIIIAVAILSFSLFWPLNNEENLQGTIGGVEKANKFRGEQPITEDVLLEDEEFAALTQSAEWQNAMKDDEFVAFLKSEEFQKASLLLNDMKNFVLMKNCFEAAKNFAPQSQEISDEELKSFYANDFQSFVIVWSHEFQKFILSQDAPQSVTFTEAMKYIGGFNQEFNAQQVFSSDMQKLVFSADFEKFVYSQEFQQLDALFKFWSNDFQKTITAFSQDFQKQILSADFQKVIIPLGQDFQKLVLSADFQKAVFSQDMQKVFASSDMQNWFSSDMQKVMLGSNIQAVQNIQFKSIMSADYQQSFLAAFKLYVGNR